MAEVFKNMLKGLVLSMVSVVLPYLYKALMAVAVPLGIKSLQAALSKNPEVIAKAKEEIKVNWKQYISDARAMAAATATRIDDYVFDILMMTDIDDNFIGQLFDMIEKSEENLFTSLFPKTITIK